MFGLGPWEMAVIACVVIILFGRSLVKAGRSVVLDRKARPGVRLEVDPKPMAPPLLPPEPREKIERLQPSAARVFVSYSRNERERAAAIVELARSLGHSVFFDSVIEPGEDWKDRIAAEIHACDVFIVLWTKAAKASAWVNEEVRFALESEPQPKIVPYRLDATPLDARLEAFQHVDFLPHVNELMRLKLQLEADGISAAEIDRAIMHKLAEYGLDIGNNVGRRWRDLLFGAAAGASLTAAATGVLAIRHELKQVRAGDDGQQRGEVCLPRGPLRIGPETAATKGWQATSVFDGQKFFGLYLLSTDEGVLWQMGLKPGDIIVGVEPRFRGRSLRQAVDVADAMMLVDRGIGIARAVSTIPGTKLEVVRMEIMREGKIFQLEAMMNPVTLHVSSTMTPATRDP